MTSADTQGQPVLRTTHHADQLTHIDRPLQRTPRCISDARSDISNCYTHCIAAGGGCRSSKLRLAVNMLSSLQRFTNKSVICLPALVLATTNRPLDPTGVSACRVLA